MKRTINKTVKKVVLIVLASFAGLFLLSLPAMLWPEAGFARVVSWPALLLDWLLYYGIFGIECLFWLVAVVNVFVGGYTNDMWGRLVLCLLAGLALLLLVRWPLVSTGFVPFSDKPFDPIL